MPPGASATKKNKNKNKNNKNNKEEEATHVGSEAPLLLPQAPLVIDPHHQLVVAGGIPIYRIVQPNHQARVIIIAPCNYVG